jgi:hypothetical protein
MKSDDGVICRDDTKHGFLRFQNSRMVLNSLSIWRLELIWIQFAFAADGEVLEMVQIENHRCNACHLTQPSVIKRKIFNSRQSGFKTSEKLCHADQSCHGDF